MCVCVRCCQPVSQSVSQAVRARRRRPRPRLADAYSSHRSLPPSPPLSLFSYPPAAAARAPARGGRRCPSPRRGECAGARPTRGASGASCGWCVDGKTRRVSECVPWRELEPPRRCTRRHKEPTTPRRVAPTKRHAPEGLGRDEVVAEESVHDLAAPGGHGQGVGDDADDAFLGGEEGDAVHGLRCVCVFGWFVCVCGGGDGPQW